MKTARQVAFDILQKIQRDDSYSNLTLDDEFEKTNLDIKDKALACNIVYGVTERIITLDYNLKLYLAQPLKKLKPQVLTILRIGAYQLLFMNKIPPSAAINESVKLVKNNQASFASGLVNAVLHKINNNGLSLPEKDADNYMSIKYSCPQWLCDMWTNSYGSENANKLLETSIGNVEMTVKVNNLLCDNDTFAEKMADEGFEVENSELLNDCYTVKGKGAVHKTNCYKDGLFHIQDLASQLCCKALDVKVGDTVLDICSAPGGKSFTLAESMNNIGKIYSMDIYKHRLELIEKSAERLGINIIETRINDGSLYNPDIPLADKILCDVPCSGLGVIRKKPEIRYKKMAEVDKLPDLQYSILCVSAKYLKTGGKLVYSTCSLNPDENENIVNKFLAEHKNYESVRVLPELKRHGENTDYISLMPHIHNSDGFFISAFRKKNEDV